MVDWHNLYLELNGLRPLILMTSAGSEEEGKRSTELGHGSGVPFPMDIHLS